MAETTKISCPHCGHEFNVEDVLAHQIEEKIENKYKQKESSLAQREQELKQKQADIDRQVEEKVLIASADKEKEIKQKVEQQYAIQVKSLSEEVAESQTQLKEFKNTKIENEQLKRSLNSQKQDLQLEYEQKMTAQLNEETQKIKQQESTKFGLEIMELKKQLEDQKNLAEEMQRKAEQGSMQLQGEVQELALEAALKLFFPFDLIEEVGKGVKGADVEHTVRNKIGADCGKILYESKRTKAFSQSWIAKLKADARVAKANFCVIVTEALPEGIERIGQIDGVWICTFNDFKGLVMVLRESLICINDAYSSQTNKGDKMHLLYDYLTGNEFKLQVEAIVNGFMGLKLSYERERMAMERIWKEREKQLDNVLINTNHFIGSVKGIIGNSLPQLKEIGAGDDVLELAEEKS